MISEEWPIAAPAADQPVEPAHRAGPDRLATVRRDFFLDPVARLSEQERALMNAMLADLVATMADEIIATLPTGLDAIGGEHHDQLLARLSRSGLLDRSHLIALLLRMADEQRLAKTLALRPGSRGIPLVQRWVADEDGAISAAAMALVLARGRRRDRYGRGRLLFDDLPVEEAVALAHAVAAGLRAPLPAHPAIDRALATAANALVSRHDENERIDALVAALVRLLERAERIDDSLVEDAAAEGEIGILSAILSRRAGIPEASVWAHVVVGGNGRLMRVARLAGLTRLSAARLVAEFGTLIGIDDPVGELARFDRLPDGAVEDLRGEWRLPETYRVALERLGGDRG